MCLLYSWNFSIGTPSKNSYPENQNIIDGELLLQDYYFIMHVLNSIVFESLVC